MSALERVARRIGMEHSSKLKGCQTDRGWIRVDRAGAKPTYHYCCGDDKLRDYLLTGDRPLRYVEARRKEYCIVVVTSPVGVAISWYEYANLVTTTQSVGAETLEKAIIALAERIEGEGRE